MKERKETQLSKPHAITMILAILREGARHGYGIIQEVERQSNHLMSFNDGILYTVLRDLEGEGLIVSEWAQSPGERQRRVYTLTERGLKELEKQIREWREFTSTYDRLISGGTSCVQALLQASFESRST